MDGWMETSPDWQGGKNWYKMMPPAGVIIPEVSLRYHQCGTKFPGWLNNAHPAEGGQQIEGEVCFSWDVDDGDNCHWSQNILVTNCGSYFVYFLPQTPACHLRYCAAEENIPQE